MRERTLARTTVTLWGRTLKSPIFASAGPNTQTVEDCLQALQSGAGAVEVSFHRGDHDVFDDYERVDVYSVIPHTKDAYNGKFYGLVSTGMHVKRDVHLEATDGN